MMPRARVFLRSPGAGDLESFTALTRRSRRFHAGWVAPARNAQAYAAYLARNRKSEFEALLVCEREEEVIVGAINLSQIVRRGFKNAYLDFWIGAAFARRGYMWEGLTLAIGYAFGKLRLHRLEANVQPANTASKSLVSSLGFRLEGYSRRYLKVGGRWRDHERWAILSEEW